MGQVHFFPFGTDFRITIGVVIFTFLLLYFYSVPILGAAVASGLAVLFLRTGLDIGINGLSLYNAFIKHLPAFTYYVSYGFILERLKFRKYIERPVFFVIITGLADILSNLFELIIRRQLTVRLFDSIVSTILLTAFIRSTVVLALFWIIRYYNLIITKEEHQKRYQDLLMHSAKLKSEIYFLKKSMQDIENAMAKSYAIYNLVQENKYDHHQLEKIVEDCLKLSIDIHEIKKDYNRIVISMEKLIPTENVYKTMKLSDMLHTVKDIFTRYLEVINQDIELVFEYDQNFDTGRYFSLISILNNLIQNSIEANTGQNSYVRVNCRCRDNLVIFSVADNGIGIPQRDRDLVFEPGFTTKYDPHTGQVSTGLGLTHIKNLAEYLKGRVYLNTAAPGITEFILEFPAETIVDKGGGE